MSIFLVLLVWFPSYILSLNVLLRRAYNSIESKTNAGSTSNPGGWLARLGWGLGEATVQVLETSPQESYEARIAFFGRSIPDDGLIGWLVPLDSIVGPCPSSSSNRKPSGTPTTIASSSPPPSFVALDGVYFHGEYIKEEEESELEDIENTGCPPLCPLFGTQPDSAEDSWNPFPNTTWIALVRRGTCSFADKVLFAQSLGASSMIVGGLDENLISMSASGTSGSRIEISSIFVGAASYQNLTRLIKESDISIGVENGTTLNVGDSNKDNEDVRAARRFGRQVPTLLIRLEGEPPWEWYTPILSLLLVLSLPSLLTLCTLVIHRLRAERRERELRAPEDIVKGLPIRVWTGRSWEKDLEQGRRYQREASETSPLLPVRGTLAEERRDAPEYGSTLDPEPSTSAPRGNRLPVINPRDHSQADLDNKEIIPEEEEEPPRRSPIPLPPSPTQPLAIPTSQHAQEDSAQSDETIPRPPWFTSQFECAICLCDFEIGDRVRVLPCGHVFHLEEVDPWLIKQRRVCPVCKYDVTNPPTALVPASSSQPDLSELAVRTSSAAAALNVDATSDLTTAPHSPNVSNRPILGSEDADHNDAHSSGRPGAEFTIGHGTTASQLLADVDRRRDEDGSRVGFLERWFGRRGDRPESTEEERR